ncbi:MAG: hypothetical protein J6Y02_21825 [Pseudobutyrivibrio sp.]|nr:hypothetical protein [Pseudobutyrivibrio sp.]
MENTFMPIVLPIILSVISSGIIQFLITRSDNKKNITKKIDSVSSDVLKLSERLEEHKATLARTHILRFADELRNGTVHSEEYFRQQILDIDTYTRYCETHPNFSNGLTVMASEYIREEYRKNYLGGDDVS